MDQPTRSPDYIAQEQAAYRDLVNAGVVLGETIPLSQEQAAFGHTGCEYHLVHTASGDDTDGASASTIRSLLMDGTYGGKPGEYTLHPIEGRAITSA